MRCFGNWWGCDACTGSGFWKLQHGQFLAASPVAFQHGQKHGLAKPASPGRQSRWAPWLLPLAICIASPKKDIPNILSLSFKFSIEKKHGSNRFQLLSERSPEPWMCTRSRWITRTLCTKGTAERRANSVSWSIPFFWLCQQGLRVSNLWSKPIVFFFTTPISLPRHGWSCKPCQRCLRQEQGTPWFHFWDWTITCPGSGQPRRW